MATSTDERIERYIDFIIRWRWAVLIAAILIALGIGTGARHLGLATNYRTFFGDDNPDLLAFEAVENIYTKNDNVLFVLQPDEGTVFNARTLEAVAELTERAWKIPYSTRVDSIRSSSAGTGSVSPVSNESTTGSSRIAEPAASVRRSRP